MHILVVITSKEPEQAWNALRFANTSLAYENSVSVFLLGSGVEAATINTNKYNIVDQLDNFHSNGGTIIGCGVCIENRKEEIPFLLEVLKCEIGSMTTLYELVAKADKVLTF